MMAGLRGNTGGGEPRTGSGVVLGSAPGPPGGGTASPAVRMALTEAANPAAADPGGGPSGAQGDGGWVLPTEDACVDACVDATCDRPACPTSPPPPPPLALIPAVSAALPNTSSAADALMLNPASND